MNAPHNERESQAQSRQVRRPRRQKDRAEEGQDGRQGALDRAVQRMNEAYERAKNP